MTSLCMIALRNKTVAQTYTFDKMQMVVSIKIQKFCYHGNVTSHFSLLGRLNLKVEKELVNFQLFAGNIEKISAIKMQNCWLAKM